MSGELLRGHLVVVGAGDLERPSVAASLDDEGGVALTELPLSRLAQHRPDDLSGSHAVHSGRPPAPYPNPGLSS